MCDVVLVNVPFAPIYNPSIQLGLLRALLEQASISSFSFHFNLELLTQCKRNQVPFGVFDYDALTRYASAGTGEVAFAMQEADELPSRAVQLLEEEGVPYDVITKVDTLFRFASTFIDYCVKCIESKGPKVVAFTTGFSQLVPAVAIAERVKQRNSQVTTVFGGPDCEHEMGESLIRAFSCIDVVVRGEAEKVFVPIVREALSPSGNFDLKGVCHRNHVTVHVNDELPEHVAMNDVPTPNYDSYFATLETHPFRATIERLLELPIEASRGCWWGQKHHCNFCGISDIALQYRRCPPERVYDQLLAQAKKYRVTSFLATDAIADMKMFQSLFPRLADATCDLSLFFEVKGNLTYEHLALLRKAGVRQIQPGLESLNTRILASIRKGTTTYQNVRLLKWARELGLNVLWNILYGLPEESSADYHEMAELCKRISHLQPPDLVPLLLDRFSPYFLHPHEYGIALDGPPAFTAFAFPGKSAAEREAISYRRRFRYLDGRNPSEYVTPLRAVIDKWGDAFDLNRIPLRAAYGDEFVIVHDQRPFFRHGKYCIEGVESEILKAADSGIRVKVLLAQLCTNGTSEFDVRKAIGALEECNLLAVLDEHCLSLPIRSRYQQNSFGNSV